jgi:DNA polymerase I-like protein with 3'-5' exonuclease and polymerase domains
LSGDPRLLEAVQSGDIYLGFAKQAGLAPAEATKATHGAVRDLCKTCVLGIGYGMEARSLGVRIGKPVAFARELLQAHHRLYARFWEWNEANIAMAMLEGQLTSVFGWASRLSPSNHNPRSFLNFPMQANGAEMMRLACSRATEDGLEICAPVHDALLLAAPLDRLDEDIARLRAVMAEASRIVLDGFEVPTDVKQIRYPARYMDGRGREMWDRIMGLLEAVEARKAG